MLQIIPKKVNSIFFGGGEVLSEEWGKLLEGVPPSGRKLDFAQTYTPRMSKMKIITIHILNLKLFGNFSGESMATKVFKLMSKTNHQGSILQNVYVTINVGI